MSMLDDALGVILGDRLAGVVELAACRRDGLIEAHARDGAVAFAPDGRTAWVRDRDPLALGDPAAFSPLSAELAALRPAPRDNHYPFAREHLAHLFGDPRAPDIAVVHSGAHNWEERGGHRGEHGSLGLVQSRAPLVLAGRGVRRLGRLERFARMADVAPTVAALLGLPHDAGRYLAAQHGSALLDLLEPDELPRRVVVFVWDGTNANVAYAMASAGELPALARLMADGAWLSRGLISTFPSVTLANHTTAVTGVHPGTHGILHNVYYDRRARRQIVTNAPEVWHLARDEISPAVETIFEAVTRAGRGRTAAVNEPADRGAGYATFDFLRSGEVATVASALPPEGDVPRSTTAFADRKREYRWASAADELAVQQAIDVWGSDPALMWVNLILPDAAAHLGGPYSDMGRAGLRDTDARLGAILDRIGWGGNETAFVLIADHGMEESDPDCKGDWDDALARAGIPFRDEGYGFVYLGEDVAG